VEKWRMWSWRVETSFIQDELSLWQSRGECDDLASRHNQSHRGLGCCTACQVRGVQNAKTRDGRTKGLLPSRTSLVIDDEKEARDERRPRDERRQRDGLPWTTPRQNVSSSTRERERKGGAKCTQIDDDESGVWL
jgi:hypothetical protein